MNQIKKTLILNIGLLIIINIFTNINFFISKFNQSPTQTFEMEKILYKDSEYYINNINSKINIIEINFNRIPDNIIISYTSDNFQNFEHFNNNFYKSNIKKEKIYVKAAINENVKDLKIQSSNGDIFSVIINPKIQYKLNLTTTMCIYLVIIFLHNIIFKNQKIDKNNTKQKILLSIILLALFTLCFNYYLQFKKTNYVFGDIYEYYYVNSIMEGKLELDYPIDETLLNSKNPYDTSNRTYDFLWDASFYKGKYYCYFGIWPILTLFIPYKMITNSYLSTTFGCLIYSILSIIGTFLIYNKIIKKYFKTINIQTYITSFLFIIFGSKILWCMHRPSFYELVSLAAYSHIMFGLYFVLFSNKRILNFIGYFLLATAVLCRPTSLLASILILPKILSNIKNKKYKFIDYFILIIPYIIIGLFTMYLNYIRFDNIFEFGVSYQLTTNNIYNLKFSITKGLYTAINYLFTNIEITLMPFKIHSVYNPIPFIGDFFIENIGGGILTTSVIGIIIIFIPKIFKYIKEKELKLYLIISLILAMILMILPSTIGSLIGRYMLDFNYLFYFIIVILSLYILKIIKNKNLSKIYNILLIISIIINYMLITTNT